MKLSKMKLALASCCVLALAACSKVEPGHVGIKVNNVSGGVQQEPLTTGYYFTPVGTSIIEYPIYTQTYTFAREGDRDKNIDGNEELTCQDKSGLLISADIGVSYSAVASKAPALYTKFRKKTDELVHTQLRNAMQDALNDECSNMVIEDIYGPGKQALLTRVTAKTQAYFEPFGFKVERLFWRGPVRLPPEVRAQINRKIANDLAALAAQANVATATANANSVRETARGKADAIALEAAALRQNPEIRDLRAIEKWNGVMPQYVGSGAVPFINVK